MSLLLPDPLRITLEPDRLVLERQVIRLTSAGFRPKTVRREVRHCRPARHSSDWTGALDGLAELLREEGSRPYSATVILANQFVHYLLLPRADFLSDDQESAVYRHCFLETFGAIAEQWELRISEADGEGARPASGIDRDLLKEIRTLFPMRHQRLDSIQPRLMAVFNEHQSLLSNDRAWLVLVERGNLIFALLDRGKLIHVRGMRIGSDWAVELPNLVERESYMAELEDPPDDLYIWQREDVGPVPSAVGSMKLHMLAESSSLDLGRTDDHAALASG